jgi:hypothetical protein
MSDQVQWIGLYFVLVLVCLVIGYFLFSTDNSDKG